MTVKQLLEALRKDDQRQDHPFSSDIVAVNDVLYHPYVARDEIVAAIKPWCIKHQPCIFGKQAAKFGLIHFCILTDRDLCRNDRDIKTIIDEEKKLWKRRALLNVRNPPHAFMLVVVSPRVAFAAPDDNLKRFAECIRKLASFDVVEVDHHTGNAIVSDYLYLKSPHDDFYYGFRFNLDFFAAAGDGRWWHDHRCPGGIAFTANSIGHMRQWQEWWSREKGTDKTERFVTFAMNTIDQAHALRPSQPAGRGDGKTSHGAGSESDTHPPDPIAEGRVTWLLNLADHIGNKPLKDGPCPFKNGAPQRLEGKDWTTYAGLLHTDHSTRAEFFRDTQPPTDKPYLMDFTYLYDTRSSDFVKFMAGVRLSEEDIYREIGRPDEWAVKDAAPTESGDARTYEATEEIRRLLVVCEKWSEDVLIEPPD